MIKKATYYFIYLFVSGLVYLCYGCSGNAAVKGGKNDSGLKQFNTKRVIYNTTGNNDEKAFRLFLNDFKLAVKANDKKKIAAMLYFPLQTQPQWSNGDLKATTINPADGLISAAEYPQYADAIFTKDAKRLIPKSGEDDLSEIDDNAPENYYKTIKAVTDKGSKLYELQQQYMQSNNKETSYGFVFGKVKGQYKIISYFCPWPVKG